MVFERHDRAGDRLTRADRSELELVAGECERAGPVAVARIAGKRRQDRAADLELATGLGRLGAPLLDLLDDVLEHVAQEDGDDGRRRLVRTQPVIVVRVGDRDPQDIAVPCDRADDGHQEEQELGVIVRRLAGLEQVVPRVIGHRPVEVLARPVDAGKRLLVQRS